jgi:hypothetical protein
MQFLVNKMIGFSDKNDSVTALDSRQDRVTESSVNTYRPTGTARGNSYYYRFSYKHRGRVRHAHIPGGNTGSAVAQSRAIEVRSAIASGMGAIEIVETIRRLRTPRQSPLP